MRLTGRQHQFLTRFVELYCTEHQALHYSELAAHLGVSPVTAYDMLRLLEERGLVRSQYVLPEGGTGRSTVRFLPTPAASRLLAGPADREELSWEGLRSRILEALQASSPNRSQDILKELLNRLPEQQSPMGYAANMVAASVLILYQVGDHAALRAIMLRLHEFAASGELGLSVLAGLVVGVFLAERATLPSSASLLNQLGRYQEILDTLSARNRRRLSQFAQELLNVLEVA